MKPTHPQPKSLITDHLDTWTSAIKAKSTAGRGGGKKQEFYGIKKLRELILELAVRGLLVPQDENDEPASELLKRIGKEKVQLVKEGKIPKEKTLPSITRDEFPFEKPPGWAFARLGTLVSKLGSGSTPRGGKSAYVENGIIFLRSQNIWNEGLELSDTAYISEATHEVMQNTQVQPRDVLLNITGASLGRSIIFPEKLGAANVSQHVTIIRLVETKMCEFVHLGILSPLVQKLVWGRQVGMAIGGLSKKVLELFEFPIPPLAEQHRIVAKVDELMALCDQLEQQQEDSTRTHAVLVETLLGALTTASDHGAFAEAWQHIASHFDTLFTTESSIEKLKQTILQLAVMGKLVPRIADEGKGSEVLHGIKDLELHDNEGPSLPDHWTCVSLGSITTLMNSGWSPACNPEPADINSWGVLKTTAVQVLEYLEFENKRLPSSLKPRPENEVMDGDILFTRAGPMNRVGILCVARPTRPKLMLSDKIIRFHLIPEIDPDFAALSMSAGYSSRYIEELKSGMAASQVNISQPKLRSVPVPIPPLAEQHRIVAKVDELMALCDRLKARLQSAQATQLHLADTLVQQAI